MRQTLSRPKFGCHQHQRGLKQKLKLSKLKFPSQIPTFQIPNLTLGARRKTFASFGNAAITWPRTNLSFCLVAISLESTTPAVISSQILTLHFRMPSVPVDNRLWPAGSNLITSSALLWETLNRYNTNSLLQIAGDKGTAHILQKFQRST